MSYNSESDDELTVDSSISEIDRKFKNDNKNHSKGRTSEKEVKRRPDETIVINNIQSPPYFQQPYPQQPEAPIFSPEESQYLADAKSSEDYLNMNVIPNNPMDAISW